MVRSRKKRSLITLGRKSIILAIAFFLQSPNSYLKIATIYFYSQLN
ncbi:hypothetical protein FDUTEX481_00409 [Tolypothrix sp. PCC 7601]|nr:hypothetical protein FDUTEX481_00409 [Tolypothrix sp. PCC 7601]